MARKVDRRSFLASTAAVGTAALAVPGVAAANIKAPADNGVLINARDYGAKGDGVTDDLAAIQSSINAAYEAGGGVVFIPAGTYIVRPSTVLRIVLRSGVSLRGAGDCSLLKIPDGLGHYYAVLEGLAGTSHVSISDLRIDQNPGKGAGTITAPGVNTSQYCIVFQHSDHITIERLTIDSLCGTSGICLTNSCSNSMVAHNAIYFRALGSTAYDSTSIFVLGSHNVIANNRVLTDFKQQAIAPGTAIECHVGPATVTGNVIDGHFFGMHVGSLGSSTGITVTGNTIRNVANGIYLWPNTGHTVTGIVIIGNNISCAQVSHGADEFGGIQWADMAGNAGTLSDVIIANNLIAFQPDTRTYASGAYKFAGVGLYPTVGSASNIEIANNTIINAPSQGIYLGRAMAAFAISSLRVSGNLLIDAGRNPRVPIKGFRASIVLNGKISNALIQKNTCLDTGSAGMSTGNLGIFVQARPASVFTNVYLDQNRLVPASGNLVNSIAAGVAIDVPPFVDPNGVMQLGTPDNPPAIPCITGVASAASLKGVIYADSAAPGQIVFFDGVTGARYKINGTAF